MSALTFLIVAVIKIAITIGVLLTVVATPCGWSARPWAACRIAGALRGSGHSVYCNLSPTEPVSVKEDVTPPFVDKKLYLLAPVLALVTALTSIAMVPIGPSFICLASAPRCRSPEWWMPPDTPAISMSGFSSFSALPRWAFTESLSRAGRPTANIRCWARCVPRRRWSAMKFRSASR